MKEPTDYPEPELVPEARRVRIPRAASNELRARYLVRADAEQRLVEFLAGILLAKGLRVDDFVSFDDERHELVLRPPTD